MKTTRNGASVKTIPTADEIAEMADAGENVTRFFSGKGRMMPPLQSVQRVNVDFTASMLQELDREAAGLNISRQAVIKTLVRRALDERYASAAGRAGK
jgi:hypothetical protein